MLCCFHHHDCLNAYEYLDGFQPVVTKRVNKK